MGNPDTSEPVIPISYLSTDISEPGKWGFPKPQAVESIAACQAACPAGVPIPRFLNFLQNCSFEKALSTILRENPIPGVCGRACYHPCESGCNRAPFDESVSIHSLERFVADAASTAALELQPIPNAAPMKIAVVGAGPAGLSCAYFLSLLGHKIVVFESREEAGGVLRWGIPEYRLPKPVLKRELRRIFSLPIELKTNTTVGKDIAFEELGRFDAAFLSPGAAISLPLSIQGETLDRILKGADFLGRINSKENARLGKDVIVVGGGNTAMDVARSARRLGAGTTVAYRRTRAEMPAIPDEIADAEEEGVRFSFLIQPVKIELTRKKKLAVTFQKMKLRSAHAGQRPKAVPIKGEFITLETDNLLAAVGESVDISWLPRKFVKGGLIHQADLAPHIFAGGDAVNQPRSIAAAIASGKKAAISIDLLRQGEDVETLEKFRICGQDAFSMEAYLKWRIEGQLPEVRQILSYEQIRTLFFQQSRRMPIRKLKHERRLDSFAEINLGYDAKKAVEAAKRCFSCGLCNYCDNCSLFCPEGVIALNPENRTRIVDYSHCKGCGTCARACPRSALTMKDPS
jgi:NADPH-dependent glutamate synthase beta subunit-like oxidoreductase